MRHNVATYSRVGVVVPSAADPRGLFQNDIFYAGPLQPAGDLYAGEPCPHYDGAEASGT